LLTIYIPIYNRIIYLKRMLDVFLEDKELFDKKIRLVISDNCSTDDLQGLCDSYISAGLNVNYHRNLTNIGGDANIRQGYITAESRYVWVLGSDDIPVPGFLREMLPLLEQGDYGVFHLAHYSDGKKKLKTYSDGNAFFEDIHVYITFISDNIVTTRFVKDIDFEKYYNTCFSQMPLYLISAFSSKQNGIYNYKWIQNGNDAGINGGYNLFDVFINQYLSILQEQVDCGRLSKTAFEKLKKKQLHFLFPFILKLLVKKENSNWDISSGWETLYNNYGRQAYPYFGFCVYLFKLPYVKLRRKLIR